MQCIHHELSCRLLCLCPSTLVSICTPFELSPFAEPVPTELSDASQSSLSDRRACRATRRTRRTLRSALEHCPGASAPCGTASRRIERPRAPRPRACSGGWSLSRGPTERKSPHAFRAITLGFCQCARPASGHAGCGPIARHALCDAFRRPARCTGLWAPRSCAHSLPGSSAGDTAERGNSVHVSWRVLGPMSLPKQLCCRSVYTLVDQRGEPFPLPAAAPTAKRSWLLYCD